MSVLPPYQIVLFLHVASAVGLFAVLAIEWVSLRGLARSLTYEQAREWSGLLPLLLLLGLPATLLVLASGIYLATTAGFWRLAWVYLAVPTYVLVILAGAIVGPRRNRLRSTLASGTGRLPGELRHQVRNPLFKASWQWRTGLLFGLLFAMTVRPDWALLGIGVFAVSGLIWSLIDWKSRDSDASVE
jgi:hypothetical protein